MAEERLIKISTVQVHGDKTVLPAESKVVASYNWSTTSKSGHPHIIIPGAPREYVSPGHRTFSLDRDNGGSLIDENASRMTSFSALEPLFRSLEVCSPGFDMDAVDIVTDRNNLRKLLKFCGSPGEATSTSTPDNFRKEPFKIMVHAIGEKQKDKPTLVFTRVVTGTEIHYPGYGGNFENKLTKKDPRAPSDAGSFRVVVKMELDGMSLLVRSEVDACETTPTTEYSSRCTRDVKENLTTKLEGLLVSSGHNSDPEVGKSTTGDHTHSISGLKGSPATSGLTSTKHGELLSDEAHIVELKTKNGRHAAEINWKDFYWQMALGGAQQLVLGLHNRGTFDDVQKLPIVKVKGNADKTGSSSMVYLVNSLREVIKAAHSLMNEQALSSGSKTDTNTSAAVVVESSPTTYGERTLRVRLAVPGDGAVAPSPCRG